MDDKKKKDVRLLICLIVVSLFGAVAIIVKQNYFLFAMYIPLSSLGILTLYFNYSLCKLENKWRAMWYERNPSDGEPSDFHLIMGKIGGWLIVIIAFVLALLPAGI